LLLDASMTGSGATAPALQRAKGSARIGFASRDGKTSLADLFQSGSAKILLPRIHGGGGPVAVLLNTAGGVTGGDRLAFEASFGVDCKATLTTQTAERVYRSAGGHGEILARVTVAAGASAEWLPQETIVFEGAAYRRRTDIDIAGDARLLALEWTVLGRTAMGETVHRAEIEENWRIRRDGRLVFADALRLSGDPAAILAGPATGGGAAAYATLVLAAPGAEAELDRARDLLSADVEAGFSTFDGLLVGRFIARDGQRLRRALTHFLEGFRGMPLPRGWYC
jgi:urease accessory protein